MNRVDSYKKEICVLIVQVYQEISESSDLLRNKVKLRTLF